MKEEWRSVLKAGGEQSVTVAGTVEMHLLCAGSLDTIHLVSKEWRLQARKYCKIELLIFHRFCSTYKCFLWSWKWSHMARFSFLHWKWDQFT